MNDLPCRFEAEDRQRRPQPCGASLTGSAQRPWKSCKAKAPPPVPGSAIMDMRGDLGADGSMI